MARSKEGTYMFSGFLEFFKKPVQYNIYGNDYRTFVIGFGGIQFGRGLFTVLDKANALVLEKKLGYAFPEYKGSFRLFGFDWMGRCFAVPSDNEDKVIVFDPGVFEAYDVSLGFRDFVNKAIPMSTNECLSSDAFISWSPEEWENNGLIPRALMRKAGMNADMAIVYRIELVKEGEYQQKK